MDAFAALSDPTRRSILELLGAGEQAAGAIGERFAMTPPAISQHLKVLREARLVRVRAEGQRRLYSLDADGLTDRQKVLITATDEFVITRSMSPETWSALSSLLSRAQLIEFCTLAGQYDALAATMATVMYTFGVVGNMGGGLLDQFLPQNWIPMFHNHASTVFTQIGIGVCFTGLYFVVFKTLIERLNLKTPGREESEIKLYSKADYKAARGQTTAPAAASQQVGQAPHCSGEAVVGCASLGAADPQS